jgi:predicted AAA+ superfamily ATPase
MAYIPRIIEPTVKKYLSIFPVVGLTGPRQSGKSTMLQKLLGDSYQYVSFDDSGNVDMFKSDPVRFMRLHDDKVIFDEAQKVPEIFNHIKLAVDADRKQYGKFVLTGSSQFHFMKKISESLAGRIGLLSLLPFQYSEIPSILREDALFRGGYPELVVREYRSAEEWYSAYIDTYLTRDVRDLAAIGDLYDFRRCLQLLAGRVSGIMNMSDLARDVGVSVPTIKKWISVLDASYIIFLLHPFYKNLGKRIVKSPKVYFFDTGLVSYLTGIWDKSHFEKGPLYGPIFENYVIAETFKKQLHLRTMKELYYFRTSHGVEVDLIIDQKDSKEWLEAKTSETFRPEMIKAIQDLKKPDEVGRLVYRGKAIPFVDNIEIINFSKYLE